MDRARGRRNRTLGLEQLEFRSLLTAVHQAVLPTPAVAAPTAAVSNADGPTVVSVQRQGVHEQPTVLVLGFSEPLDAARATNPSNYRILNFLSRPIGVGSATYDAATQTVTVFPRQRINLHHTAQLLVVGTGPTGVTSSNGVPLDGANAGVPGSSFSTLLSRRNLVGGP
jgi:type VI secretion system secreted protein VgrG